ncbi:hypothetical protein ACFVSK_10295 [Cellulosimicrobium cellulans]|uniref:hypothetical protein n=1 Tax=Cellulosimicrobium cellulans TaxID=1710 RepID=UPI0036E899C3
MDLAYQRPSSPSVDVFVIHAQRCTRYDADGLPAEFTPVPEGAATFDDIKSAIAKGWTKIGEHAVRTATGLGFAYVLQAPA